MFAVRSCSFQLAEGGNPRWTPWPKSHTEDPQITCRICRMFPEKWEQLQRRSKENIDFWVSDVVPRFQKAQSYCSLPFSWGILYRTTGQWNFACSFHVSMGVSHGFTIWHLFRRRISFVLHVAMFFVGVPAFLVRFSLEIIYSLVFFHFP